MVLRSIGVLSAGKVLGLTYTVFGLIPGAMFALIALAGAVVPQPQGNGPNPVAIMAGLGVAAIVVIPIMYGVMGFIGGIIGAVIYNLIASVAGGLEFEFEQTAATRISRE